MWRENDSESFDDDPFNYIPIARSKRPRRPRKKPQKPILPADFDTVLLPSPKTTDNTRCSVCRLPFSLLLPTESRFVHAANCLETNFNILPDCLNGSQCDVLNRKHFIQYKHHTSSLSDTKSLNPVDDRTNRSKDSINLIVESESQGDVTNQNLLSPHKSVRTSNSPVPKSINSGDDRSKDSINERESQSDVTNQNHSSPSKSVRSSPVPNTINHVKVQANHRKDSINVAIEVDSSVRLKKLLFQISPTAKSKKQSSIHDFFRSSSTKSQSKPPSPSPPPSSSSSFNKVKSCPFYKKIQGTSFVVDAFNYGVIPGISTYFLSHFHYDHYIGLSKKFHRPIVCSPVTARLLTLKIKIESKYIKPLEMNEPVVIDDVEVTLLNANHCPGSVMFLFKLLDGSVILHTGDFRASPEMEEYPSLWNAGRISRIHLDTTYCSPEYDFPPQDDVIAKTIQLVQDHLRIYPDTLIVVGSYTIGKERVFIALSEALNAQIYTPISEKNRILETLQDDVINKRLSRNPKSQIHVLTMKSILQHEFLVKYRRTVSHKYNQILSIKPTGWTHHKGSRANDSLNSMKLKKCANDVWTMEVPYSEHSSYSELKRFIQFLDLTCAESVIPTVNVGSHFSRYEMKKIFQSWIEKEERTIFKYLSLGTNN